MRGAAGAALAAGILGALALPAAADEAWQRCIDNSDGTNPAWAACGGAWVAREDAKLNAAWKRLLAASGPETRKDLLEEQRAWNAFMQKACHFYDRASSAGKGRSCISRPAAPRSSPSAPRRSTAMAPTGVRG